MLYHANHRPHRTDILYYLERVLYLLYQLGVHTDPRWATSDSSIGGRVWVNNSFLRVFEHAGVFRHIFSVILRQVSIDSRVPVPENSKFGTGSVLRNLVIHNDLAQNERRKICLWFIYCEFVFYWIPKTQDNN
jgi:hypothetical protein